MSRAKFEKWFREKYGYMPMKQDRECWLAGRESMRDEAAKRVKEVDDTFIYDAPSGNFLADEIRRIEP